MRKIIILGFSFVLWGFLTVQVNAQIVINEVLPDTAATLDKSEWIELWNYSSEEVDVNGWNIDGNPLLSETDPIIIEPNNYLILTKNRDEFITEFSDLANLFELNISLKNSEDIVILTDPEGNIIDEFSYSSSEAGISWERVCHDSDEIVLHTDSHTLSDVNLNIGGTCLENSGNQQDEGDEEGEEDTENQEQETEELLPWTISISEVFPSPDTGKGETEWIELYNFGENKLELTGIRLVDPVDQQILENLPINPHEYILLENLELSLNNTGDILQLISPTGEILDEFHYEDSSKSISLIRIEGSIVQTLVPTPASENILVSLPVLPEKTKEVSKKKTTSEESVKAKASADTKEDEIYTGKSELTPSKKVKLDIPKLPIKESEKELRQGISVYAVVLICFITMMGVSIYFLFPDLKLFRDKLIDALSHLSQLHLRFRNRQPLSS